jgi:hypothetical protein
MSAFDLPGWFRLSPSMKSTHAACGSAAPAQGKGTAPCPICRRQLARTDLLDRYGTVPYRTVLQNRTVARSRPSSSHALPRAASVPWKRGSSVLACLQGIGLWVSQRLWTGSSGARAPLSRRWYRSARGGAAVGRRTPHVVRPLATPSRPGPPRSVPEEEAEPDLPALPQLGNDEYGAKVTHPRPHPRPSTAKRFFAMGSAAAPCSRAQWDPYPRART